jgi:predicted nucleic acid-binding protein
LIVLDSSAAVDFLLLREHADWVDDTLRAAGEVHAPHVLDVEVVSAVRRLVRLGDVTRRLAASALTDLQLLDVTRYPHLPFVERMWQLRENLSASDAAFVALAEALGAPLVTTDVTLAASPGPRIPIVTP